jgi:sulfoxide reductase heme-binding subunit YedZ
LSALLVIALLATSNDYSLRKLRTRGWKKLQRWNYAVFALAGAHALLYQEGVEKQQFGFVAMVIVCVVLTAALQAIVFARRRNGTTPRTTSVL